MNDEFSFDFDFFAKQLQEVLWSSLQVLQIDSDDQIFSNCFSFERSVFGHWAMFSSWRRTYWKQSHRNEDAMLKTSLTSQRMESVLSYINKQQQDPLGKIFLVMFADELLLRNLDVSLEFTLLEMKESMLKRVLSYFSNISSVVESGKNREKEQHCPCVCVSIYDCLFRRYFGCIPFEMAFGGREASRDFGWEISRQIFPSCVVDARQKRSLSARV